MPITQSRMIELLTAAEDYQQAYAGLRESIRHAHQSVARGQSTSQSALDGLLVEVGVTALKQAKSNAVVLLTRQHYKKASRRNDRRRENYGALDHSKAPASILAQGSAEVPESPEVLALLELDKHASTRHAVPDELQAELAAISRAKALQSPTAPPRTFKPGPRTEGNPALLAQQTAEEEAAEQEAVAEGLSLGEDEEQAPEAAGVKKEGGITI